MTTPPTPSPRCPIHTFVTTDVCGCQKACDSSGPSESTASLPQGQPLSGGSDQPQDMQKLLEEKQAKHRELDELIAASVCHMPKQRAYNAMYRRGYHGTIKRLYAGVKARCNGKKGNERYKGMSYPDELTFYVQANRNDQLHKIWEAWVRSGFQPQLAPSVDRIDNERGYEIDNIQFLTRSDNTSKYLWEDLPDDGERGVSRHKGKWRADTTVDGNYYCIGLFETKRDAAVAHKFFREFFRELKDKGELIRSLEAEHRRMREALELLERKMGVTVGTILSSITLRP